MTNYSFSLTLFGDGYKETSLFRADQKAQLEQMIAKLTARNRRFVVTEIK